MFRTTRQMATWIGITLYATAGLAIAPHYAFAADAAKSAFQASDSATKAVRSIQEERISTLLKKTPAYPETLKCLSSETSLWTCYDQIKASKKISPTRVTTNDILQANVSEGIAQVFLNNHRENSDILAITAKGRVLETEKDSLISASHDLTMIKDANIPYLTKMKEGFWEQFVLIMPIIGNIFLLFIFIVFGVMQGRQILHFFSSPATRMNPDDIVPFSEIAGNDYVKKELLEISAAIKSNDKAMLNAIPSGILMAGPPGCGKTMMAAAFAKECGLPFYHVAGADFVEMFVGMGARRVSIMFKRLRRRHKVSILFIDEIDSIGRARSNHGGASSSEHEDTLNKMLQMMDGASNKTKKRRKKGRVIVLGATNRPDILDPALLRPERLERTVTFQLPPQEIREQIAAIYMKEHTFSPDVTPKIVGIWTPGFSGADIKSMINQAMIQARREQSSVIKAAHITHAIDLHLMGEPSQVKLSQEDRDITAWHEGGHALIAMLILGADRVRSITILPRGQAMGMVAIAPPEGRYSQSLNDLIGSIFVAVSGRAGEFIRSAGDIEKVTTGASQDIVQASDVARDIIERFGFTPITGMSTHTFIHGHPRFGREQSQKRSAEIDDLVTAVISAAFDEVERLLKENSAAFQVLTKMLLEKETLTGLEAWAAISGLVAKGDGVCVAFNAITRILQNDTKTDHKDMVPKLVSSDANNAA